MIKKRLLFEGAFEEDEQVFFSGDDGDAAFWDEFLSREEESEAAESDEGFTVEVMDEEMTNDAGEEAHDENLPSGSGRRWLWIGLVAVLAIVGGVGYWKGDALLPSVGAYQAVFLDNNQVYFGRLTNTASAYPVLKDIFYLRVTQPLQPPSGGATQPDINLVKLGTELHGPSDEMRINKEHILFIEDLKADSEVTKAINNFKDYQKQQAK